MAIRARNMLQNGMGGIDWAGLPLVAAHIGVTDAEALLDALEVLITHEPDRPADGRPKE
jgi:hypothetical protein